jgi:multidrug efflux pump subunit AcrB
MNKPAHKRPQIGISGIIARYFQGSKLTPLLALTGLLLGLFAVIITPKEEDPQIDVTMADVMIPFPGASAEEVEHLVATPAEQVLSEMAGVKHIYSASQAGMAIVTVQFKVGIPRQEALVRLYNQVFSHQDWLPKNLGTLQPIIKPKGIDDVPIVTLTLWDDQIPGSAESLAKVAHALEIELKQIPGTRNINTIGAPQQIIRVILNPVKLNAYHIDMASLKARIQAGNLTSPNTSVVKDNKVVEVQVGDLMKNADQLKKLVIGIQNQQPIYLSDVATFKRGSDVSNQGVFYANGPAMDKSNSLLHPAVTIAIAKKPGSNAVEVAEAIGQKLAKLKGTLIPSNLHIEMTRDYGHSADDKSTKLIHKLIFATAIVILLVGFALGIREAIVVGTAVIVTLAITLFASWAWGFTLNRVSLFALIFSIGILVDDAIVVVENIHRHMRLKTAPLSRLIPEAVDEVGGPTILATLTVIAALMPMAFVSGLMGPYMSPIPINASTGMLISLLVAFTLTPWMARHLLVHHEVNNPASELKIGHEVNTLMHKIIRPFLIGDKNRRHRHMLYLGIFGLIGIAVALPMMKVVILKMLPFDNKSELSIVVDMPEGTPYAQTLKVLSKLAAPLSDFPEVKDYQLYAGTASPINFNGLVRQYYLRNKPNMGDIQINLIDKHLRKRQSHTIALAIREPLQKIAARYHANIKVTEVPPGPPVLAPLVAEVYGDTQAERIKLAKEVKATLHQTPEVVDLDDSLQAQAPRWVFTIDREKTARLGLNYGTIVQTLYGLIQGTDVSYLHDDLSKFAVPIRLKFSEHNRSTPAELLSLTLTNSKGQSIPLSEVVHIQPETISQIRLHKDLRPVVYVTADAAGKTDSPLYAMFTAASSLSKQYPNVPQHFTGPPNLTLTPSIKWDGEWQITYETFRDMGIAYAVGLIFIYLLIVAQFGSYIMPLVIMAPIPLTIIGVMPGHALLGDQFTATSMIGMIALAGIIVRNSILLVEFINQEREAGVPLEQAVMNSAAVRARPIILTALAAILGAFFILSDPIFSGLAVSLIFGIFVSSLLTLIVIPLLYYSVSRRKG